MRDRDSKILEEAYRQIIGEESYWDRDREHKEVYDKIMPIARELLDKYGKLDSLGRRVLIWDVESELERSLYGVYSQFCLRSVKRAEQIEFGNWYRGQLIGKVISPHAVAPKEYGNMLRVLVGVRERAVYWGVDEVLPELKGMF